MGIFRILKVWLQLTILASVAYGQQNGRLQIHYMSVGQGDGAVLISPNGETVLFDSGVANYSELPISYMQQLGVTKIHYHITSHYHNDHMGVVPEVLSEFPLVHFAFDRGGSYDSKTFDRYRATVGSKRRQAVDGSSLILDHQSQFPVRIDFIASNGNGIETSNENDMSLVAVVRFGKFDAVFAGDLSGMDTGNYEDIESSVAPKVGQVEVYKVNHHGSRYSSNENWMRLTKPMVGVISCGDGNSHKHPTAACLKRLHSNGIKRVYWTARGNGAQPKDPQDKIAGNTIIEVEPGSSRFKVIYGGEKVDNYDMWDSPPVGAPGDPSSGETFAWSKLAKVYHVQSCPYVKNISPWNIGTGNSPPDGKHAHNCVK